MQFTLPEHSAPQMQLAAVIDQAVRWFIQEDRLDTVTPEQAIHALKFVQGIHENNGVNHG